MPVTAQGDQLLPSFMDEIREVPTAKSFCGHPDPLSPPTSLARGLSSVVEAPDSSQHRATFPHACHHHSLGAARTASTHTGSEIKAAFSPQAGCALCAWWETAVGVRCGQRNDTTAMEVGSLGALLCYPCVPGIYCLLWQGVFRGKKKEEIISEI